MKSTAARYGLVLAGCLIALVLGGCSTPPELKEASKAQLELVAALDKAVAELQSGVDAFHREQERLIVEAAYVDLSTQAIDLALDGNEPDAEVTVDEVFKTYKRKVEALLAASFVTPGRLGTWDFASVESDAKDLLKRAKAVKRADNKSWSDSERDAINAAGEGWFNKLIAFYSNPAASELQTIKNAENALRGALSPAGAAEAAELTEEARDIRRRHPTQVDDDYADLFQTIAGDVASVQRTRIAAKRQFKILRDQIAVMKVAAVTIDAWLHQDVTINEDQAKALSSAFSDAHSALSRGSQ